MGVPIPNALRLCILRLVSNGAKPGDVPDLLVQHGWPRREKTQIYSVLRGERAAARHGDRRRSNCAHLDAVVSEIIRTIGHNYGWRSVKVDAEEVLGEVVSKRSVKDSMRRVNPWAFDTRRCGAARTACLHDSLARTAVPVLRACGRADSRPVWARLPSVPGATPIAVASADASTTSRRRGSGGRPTWIASCRTLASSSGE